MASSSPTSNSPRRRPEERGVAAEQAGFDAVWTSIHFHPSQDNQDHSGQARVTLAALAMRTRSIRFATGVTSPSFRCQPTLVARAVASLAAFAPGRVFPGLDSGEALNEVPAGGGWDDTHSRLERMLETTGRLLEVGGRRSVRGPYPGHPEAGRFKRHRQLTDQSSNLEVLLRLVLDVARIGVIKQSAKAEPTEAPSSSTAANTTSSA